jgi:RNA polymerase sigma factor (sigma-70 family)
MMKSPLNGVASALSRLAAATPSDLSDAELLERFRRGGEEAAFALLVQRHGPAVRGVCRRLLGNAADADDAFQATFLVLLRKANSVHRSGSLGCWLYGVAWRVAVKARGRRLPTVPAGDDLVSSAGDPVAEATYRELTALLDEEVRRLPEKYRLPLVVCGLEGRTYEQAARDLCTSKSSLGRRVEQARELLRLRLTRRGVVVPAAVLTAVLAREASAAVVPATLILATVRLTRQTAAAAASAPAIRLAEQVTTGAPPARWLAALGLAAAVGLGVTGAYTGEAASPDPPASPAETPGAVVPAQRADREGFALPAEALARVGSARLRHGVHFRCLNYSPDGTLLASCGSGLVRLWDAKTGKLVSQAKLPNAWESVFSADGKTVVVYDRKACHWLDVRTGNVVRSCAIALPEPQSAYRLSPRGEMIAINGCGGRNEDLVVYDLPSANERFRYRRSGFLSDGSVFSPDGKTLAALGWDAGNTLRLFDTATGQLLGQVRTGNRTLGLAFSADGKRLLGHDDKKNVRVWSVPDGKVLYQAESTERGLLTVAFAPDGASILRGDNRDVVRIDLATGKELCRFPVGSNCWSMAIAPDGRWLATGDEGNAVLQWDLATGQARPASADPVANFFWRCLRFESGGRLLWSWSGAYVATDWQAGREVRRIPAPREAIAWPPVLSPDRSRLALVNSAKKHFIRDTSSGKDLFALPDSVHFSGSQVFTPDGKVLFTSEWDGPVRSRDVATGKERPAFDTVPHFMPTLVVSPDGRWLAVADLPGAKGARPEVTIFDLHRGTEHRRLRPRPATQWAWDLAFSPDGTRLALAGWSPVGSDPEMRGSITVWNVRTGEEVFSQAGFADRFLCVAYSPDGRQVAAGGHDGVLSLWEVATGRERHRFTGHIAPVHDVAFSPDGKFVAAASDDAPVYVWDVEGCYGKPPSTVPFSGEEAENLWQTLNDSNATAAFDAMRHLLNRPVPTAALLRERLKPAPPLDDKVIRQLLRDLDADDFAVRERAAAELELLADRAAPALRKALDGKPSEEVKRRVGQLLESTGPGAPGLRREVRAVEVAERLGTAEARQLLDTWAGGDKDAALTREARAAVERLKAR